ncbi:MAG TPA: hypothetical protein VF041_11750 [Gemmatimonadaceae bacterium]
MRKAVIPLLASAALLAACSGDTPLSPTDRIGQTADGPSLDLASGSAAAGVTVGRVALVARDGTRPALYVQNADGSGRIRIHFGDLKDDVEGNYTQAQLPVDDDHIVAIRNPRWSPDGTQLAVVVSAAYDQSEVIVVNADGTNGRVMSNNAQYIISAPHWSPDGSLLTYTMSTRPFVLGLDLFETRLATSTVRRITTGFGDPTFVVWSADGHSLVVGKGTGSTYDPVFNFVSMVGLVDPASGAVQPVRTGIIGQVYGLARSAAWALVLRNGESDGSASVSDVVRQPVVGYAPTVRIASGTNIVSARLLGTERHALIEREVSGRSGESAPQWTIVNVETGAGVVLPGLEAGVSQIDPYVTVR